MRLLAAAPDQPGQLASVTGTISNPEAINLTAGVPLRVAILWGNGKDQPLADGGRSRGYATAQDVAVTTSFPASFTLKLTDTELPPEVTPLAPGLRSTAGMVVAYEDTNGDGKLDLVGEGDDPATQGDRVLGVSPSVAFYLEGVFPDDASSLEPLRDAQGKLPPLGFSFAGPFCA